MIPNQIEKEILIEATIELVWQVITEPEHMRQWFADQTEIDLRVGGHGALSFRGQDSYLLQVEALDPPRRFAFRWVRRPETVVRADNSLLVEFSLQPEGGHTRLRVVESGFESIDWSDEEKAKYADRHSNGWQTILGRLRDHVASTRT